LAWFPRWLHRLLTDPGYAREKLAFVFVRPLRLYFNAAYREQWLRDMVTEGHRNHMLTEDDADTILRQLGEPFIQKYLKCLAVHVCTLPITKAVAMAMALVYVAQHPDLSWGAAWGVAIAIIVFFQTTPISPGSIVRGLYTLGVVIRERDLKNYNIAAVLSFFKTIGYLAFPIQMARRYPALARFMAGHWATGVVHALPVFGERGALLEHGMFQLFYNRPLTVRRRLLVRAEREAGPKPRDWHTVLCAAGAAALLVSVEAAFLHETGEPPQFAQAWWAVLGALLPCGWFVAREARGLSSGRRIVAGALTGAFAALLHIGGHIALKRLILGHAPLLERSIRRGLTLAPREMFFFALLAALGALLAEVLAPMPCPHLSRDAGSPKSETRNPKESQSTKHQFPE
jgi:hypothetical protein